MRRTSKDLGFLVEVYEEYEYSLAPPNDDEKEIGLRKKGDLCLARIVAISHKGDEPKMGLTMRQPGLGKLEWIKEDQLKKEREAKKVIKEEKSVKKKKGEGKKK